MTALQCCADWLAAQTALQGLLRLRRELKTPIPRPVECVWRTEFSLVGAMALRANTELLLRARAANDPCFAPTGEAA